MTEGSTGYKSLEQASSLGKGQDKALEWLVETKQPVAVFLISGIKLEGVISSFDQYCLLLTDYRGNQQLIYKAKVSTIAIAGPRKKDGQKPRRDHDQQQS